MFLNFDPHWGFAGEKFVFEVLKKVIDCVFVEKPLDVCKSLGGLESGGHQKKLGQRIWDLAPYMPILKKRYTGPYSASLPLFREI